MKVACVVSPGSAHLDFGGFGFIKLAKQLHSRGHEVTWITTEEQAARLKGESWAIDLFPTQGLDLQPFQALQFIPRHPIEYRRLLDSVRGLEALLHSRRPDLILIDRVLSFAAAVAQRASIPWVSVGKPAGWWVGTGYGTLPSRTPVDNYISVSEQVNRDLAWNGITVNSLWANSPHLNISFLGQDFYVGTDTSGFPSAYVSHFDDVNRADSRHHIGISFGNTGNPVPLVRAARCLAETASEHNQLDLFVGKRQELSQQLGDLTMNPFVHLHGWVDFSLYFQRLRALLFLGGNGTLWQCVNHFVPMIIVPSEIGDQRFNAIAMHRLKLGHYVEHDKLSCSDIRKIMERLAEDFAYRENIAHFRQPDNYTHTIESVTLHLEGMVL